jgi:nucleosome assembly protein 1-like 1
MAGKAQATPQEIDAGEKQSIKDDPDYTPLPQETVAAPEGIPQFWLTALRNHPGLSEIITERDAGALRHLIDVRLSYLPTTDPKPGFKIAFVFEPNEYFENGILEKTYLYQEEVGYSGDFVYDRAIGTEIKWKEDKDLTKEFEIKKQRNKSMDLIGTSGAILTTLLLQIPTALAWFAKPVRQTRSSTSSHLPFPLATMQSRMAI